MLNFTSFFTKKIKIKNLPEKNDLKRVIDDFSNPLASITICSFNQERFIRECVESVLAQTYSPLEIIISDDGSTDQTPKIIESCLANYKGKHKVSCVLHPCNLGEKGANNFLNVYQKTTGSFVIQFCGDDIMLPQMVENMIAVWKSNKVSMVTVNAELIDSDSLLLNKQYRDPTKIFDFSLEAIARDGVNDAVFGAGMGCSRELLEYFGYADKIMPPHLTAQDIMFTFFACLLNGCEMVTTPQMKYRVHGDQGSISIAIQRAKSELRKLVLEEKQWNVHLAHALFMCETLQMCITKDPLRFKDINDRIETLLHQQIVTMATRIANVRKKLFYLYGVSEIKAESDL